MSGVMGHVRLLRFDFLHRGWELERKLALGFGFAGDDVEQGGVVRDEVPNQSGGSILSSSEGRGAIEIDCDDGRHAAGDALDRGVGRMRFTTSESAVAL